MAPITDVGTALTTAFANALSTFFSFIPALIGAIIILLIGWVLGRVVGTLVTKALRTLKFDRIADKADISEFLRNAGLHTDAAGVIGALAKWFIYLITFQAAASTLKFPQLTVIFNEILAFIPRIALAVIILLIGALAGKVLAGIVRGSLKTARFGDANLLADIARWAVIAFAVVAALSQVEIAPTIVNTLWTVVIGSVGLAFALAVGLGSRDAAGHMATGQMLKGDLQPGMQIGVDGQEGTIERIGAIYTTLRADGRQIDIPNADLAGKVISIIAGGPAPQISGSGRVSAFVQEPRRGDNTQSPQSSPPQGR